jgi:membrane fusion protein (multidrug efflux system)
MQNAGVHRVSLLAVVCLQLGLGGCRSESKADAGPPPPVEVGVVTLQPQSVLLTTELPGRTSAYEVSEVRPQVSGVIRARLFTEGQTVEKGQTLYQIDARLYRATAAQARANLASARAQNEAAQAKAERYRLMLAEGVVSAQDYTDAHAAASAAAASIEQTRAALDTASINLRFTEVPAPISGRIGRSLVTTGALVTEGQTSPLTTIQRLDPMFVDLQQSSSDMLALRRSLATAGNAAASADVQLELEDGSDYDRIGTLQFAEATVDPSTGSVTLRARFDNPDGLLLPGMYVRAIVGQSERRGAILAPQQGVTRNPKGQATALVVGPDDKVVQKAIETSRVLGDQWLVEKGLAAGDRVIVEGTDKVKPGQLVRPVPMKAATNARPAQGDDTRPAVHTGGADAGR